jgi:DNA-binding response OmpR family regulator
MRILVAEDDRKVRSHVVGALRAAGHAVDDTGDGEEALWLLRENPYDAAVLDITMPGRDGVSVTRSARAAGCAVPVLLATARGEVRDKVSGLDAGADDYIVKPYSTEELLARLRALQRRARPELDSVLRVADLEIDLRGRIVRRAGQEIALTNREFSLLEVLAEASPRAVSKATLVERVWDQHFDSGTNVLNVYVNYLRKKVDLPGCRPLIHTLRGVGFALREESV